MIRSLSAPIVLTSRTATARLKSATTIRNLSVPNALTSRMATVLSKSATMIRSLSVPNALTSRTATVRSKNVTMTRNPSVPIVLSRKTVIARSKNVIRLPAMARLKDLSLTIVRRMRIDPNAANRTAIAVSTIKAARNRVENSASLNPKAVSNVQTNRAVRKILTGKNRAATVRKVVRMAESPVSKSVSLLSLLEI